jgi:hypothetical protein
LILAHGFEAIDKDRYIKLEKIKWRERLFYKGFIRKSIKRELSSMFLMHKEEVKRVVEMLFYKFTSSLSFAEGNLSGAFIRFADHLAVSFP